MKLRDYMTLGLDQLKRRLVVTLLCAMGIAIGSAAIIVALSFGESITHYAKQQMTSFLKMDEINVASNGGSAQTTGSGAAQAGLSQAKIDLIRTLPHVRSAALFRTIDYVSFRADDTKNGSLRLVEADLDKLPQFGYEIGQGTFAASDNAIVISYSATFDLFDERIAQLQASRGGNYQRTRVSYPLYQKMIVLTKYIDMGNGKPARAVEIPVRVVGVLKKPDGAVGYEGEKLGYVSSGLAKRIDELIKANSNGQLLMGEEPTLKIKVDSPSHVAEVETLIRKLNLQTQSNIHYEKEANSQYRIIRFIFGGAGLFILFVASISIVVAMTMSTYQRRRQIGIMKVLGANLAQIRNMFIVESSLLGLIGGLVGILLSYWVVWTINIVLKRFADSDQILFISLWILPVGLLFALLTGVLSGIYPAIKASHTDALTAIKRD